MDEIRKRQSRLSKYLLIINFAFSVVFICVAIYIAIYSKDQEARYFYDTSSAIQSVKGASDRKPLTKEEAVIFNARKSLVSVSKKYCASVTLLPSLASKLGIGIDKSYIPFCSQTLGLGFFVDQNGLIATSTDTLISLPKELLINAENNGLFLNPKESSISMEQILEGMDSGTVNFKIDSSNILVEYGAEEKEAKIIDLQSSVALIKIDNKNQDFIDSGLPTLQEILRTGKQIYSFYISNPNNNSNFELKENGDMNWKPREIVTSEHTISAVKRTELESTAKNLTSGSPIITQSGELVGVVSHGKLQKADDLRNLIIKNIIK